MNFKISFGTKFKRDFKTIKRRGYPIEQQKEVFVFIGKTRSTQFQKLSFQSPLPNAVGMTDPVTPDFNPADWTRCLTRSAVGKGSSQSETQLLSDARWG